MKELLKYLRRVAKGSVLLVIKSIPLKEKHFSIIVFKLKTSKFFHSLDASWNKANKQSDSKLAC